MAESDHAPPYRIDGQFIEVHPDSLETDSARKARPVYHSDAGRVVYGGGAVTPDVMVRADTLSTAEQTLAKALAPKLPDVFGILSDLAFEQKGKVTPEFTMKPEWREEFYNRLQKANVKVDRATWDAGHEWVDRQIELRVARVAFGDSTATRHALREDPQLQKAIDILKKGGTQKDLFAIAQASMPTPR